MWEDTIIGIARSKIEILECYQIVDDESVLDEVSEYTLSAIRQLPWHFKLPIRLLAVTVNLVCLATTGHKLTGLPTDRRVKAVRRMNIVPFYKTLDKLVQAMALLSLFDSSAMTQSD